jgi:phosphatidylserine/phosphatidylglycerophosphate/cardiolipin synthase-like enzyme
VKRDCVVIEPAQRRAAVLRVIRGARRRQALTIYRSNDDVVLDAVEKAAARGVEVDVLLTRRASGWRRRLDRLRVRLERMGVRVTRHGARSTKRPGNTGLTTDIPFHIAGPYIKCHEH